LLNSLFYAEVKMAKFKLYKIFLLICFVSVMAVVQTSFLLAQEKSIPEMRAACWKIQTEGSKWNIRSSTYKEQIAQRDLSSKDGYTIFRKGEKIRVVIQLRSKGNRKLAMGCVPEGSQLYLKNSSNQQIVSSYTAGINGWNFGEEYSGNSPVRACAYHIEWGEFCTKNFVK
jgi:hypothetical protein